MWDMEQSESMKKALEKNEMRMEHQINLFRAILFVVSLIMDAANASIRDVFNEQYRSVLIVAVPVLGFYLFLVHRMTSGKYRPWIKYLTISVDYLVLTLVFLEMRQPPFSEIFPSIIMIPLLTSFAVLLNMLSAFRYSLPSVIYSTTLGAILLLLGSLAAEMPFEIQFWSIPTLIASGFLVRWISTNLREAFLKLRQRETLIRFLPKDVVDLIDAGALTMELGGKEIKATILFADIRNFTSISEKHAPSEILRMLNQYFSAMAEIIFRNGGMIDKYIGDAIMAVFGAPRPAEDDARRALNAAREMDAALEDLNHRLASEGLETIRTGIALHTGVVVAGNIGSLQRMDYSVIGDAVNLTSRLEGLNKQFKTRLLFSDRTRQEIMDDLPCQFVARAQIRGKSEPVDVYTLASLAPPPEESGGIS